MLVAVKSFHSLAFFVIQSSVLYLLYSGLRRRTDRRAAIAFAIAGGESLIYAGNGFRCPLTGVAEDLSQHLAHIMVVFHDQHTFLHRTMLSFSTASSDMEAGAGPASPAGFGASCK